MFSKFFINRPIFASVLSIVIVVTTMPLTVPLRLLGRLGQELCEILIGNVTLVVWVWAAASETAARIIMVAAAAFIGTSFLLSKTAPIIYLSR